MRADAALPEAFLAFGHGGIAGGSSKGVLSRLWPEEETRGPLGRWLKGNRRPARFSVRAPMPRAPAACANLPPKRRPYCAAVTDRRQ
jgi:hypothetical protein